MTSSRTELADALGERAARAAALGSLADLRQIIDAMLNSSRSTERVMQKIYEAFVHGDVHIPGAPGLLRTEFDAYEVTCDPASQIGEGSGIALIDAAERDDVATRVAATTPGWVVSVQASLGEYSDEDWDASAMIAIYFAAEPRRVRAAIDHALGTIQCGRPALAALPDALAALDEVFGARNWRADPGRGDTKTSPAPAR